MLRVGGKKVFTTAIRPVRSLASRAFSTGAPRAAEENFREAKPDLLSELRKAPRPRM